MTFHITDNHIFSGRLSLMGRLQHSIRFPNTRSISEKYLQVPLLCTAFFCPDRMQ